MSTVLRYAQAISEQVKQQRALGLHTDGNAINEAWGDLDEEADGTSMDAKKHTIHVDLHPSKEAGVRGMPTRARAIRDKIKAVHGEDVFHKSNSFGGVGDKFISMKLRHKKDIAPVKATIQKHFGDHVKRIRKPGDTGADLT